MAKKIEFEITRVFGATSHWTAVYFTFDGNLYHLNLDNDTANLIKNNNWSKHDFSIYHHIDDQNVRDLNALATKWLPLVNLVVTHVRENDLVAKSVAKDEENEAKKREDRINSEYDRFSRYIATHCSVAMITEFQKMPKEDALLLFYKIRE